MEKVALSVLGLLANSAVLAGLGGAALDQTGPCWEMS